MLSMTNGQKFSFPYFQCNSEINWYIQTFWEIGVLCESHCLQNCGTGYVF
jgi:hypothetical protein